MKKEKRLIKYEFVSAIFSMILGTLLHFTYDWSDKNTFVGIFSAINESTWEHLKILFFPILITTIIGYFYTKKETDNYICYKVKGLLLSIIFTTVFFYTYNGVLGSNILILDISSFYASIILGEVYTIKQIKKKEKCNQKVTAFILILLTISFVVYTFYTPHIGIFKDPLSNTYGIYKRLYG